MDDQTRSLPFLMKPSPEVPRSASVLILIVQDITTSPFLSQRCISIHEHQLMGNRLIQIPIYVYHWKKIDKFLYTCTVGKNRIYKGIGNIAIS